MLLFLGPKMAFANFVPSSRHIYGIIGKKKPTKGKNDKKIKMEFEGGSVMM